MSDTQRTVLAKYLLERATRALREDSPFAAGVAVSFAQDAIELQLRTIASRQHVDERDFGKLWEKLKAAGVALPYSTQVHAINAARIAFKHHGVPPEHQRAADLVGDAELFLAKSCSEHLEIDFEAISLSDMVANEAVRDHLKSAEAALQARNFAESVVESRTAVDIVAATYRKLRGRRSTSDLESAAQKIAGAMNDLRGYTRDVVNAITNELDWLERIAMLNVLGIPLGDWLAVEKLAPHVNFTVGGQRFVHWNRDPLSVTEEEASLLCRIARAAALRADAATETLRAFNRISGRDPMEP